MLCNWIVCSAESHLTTNTNLTNFSVFVHVITIGCDAMDILNEMSLNWMETHTQNHCFHFRMSQASIKKPGRLLLFHWNYKIIMIIISFKKDDKIWMETSLHNILCYRFVLDFLVSSKAVIFLITVFYSQVRQNKIAKKKNHFPFQFHLFER